MPSCPICQFQNPLANRFCQQCGTALIPGEGLDAQTSARLLVVPGAAIPVLEDPQAEDAEDTHAAPTKLLGSVSQDSGGSDGNSPTELLPNRLSKLEAVARTDPGWQRDHNEDYFFSQTQVIQTASPLGTQAQARGLYILCDGMGGHANGEVASSLATTLLAERLQSQGQPTLPTDEQLLDALYQVNQAIYEINEQNTCAGNHRMGTTLVVLIVQDTEVRVAHLGDSRLYRLTQEQGLEQITLDHVVAAREIERGVAPALAYARQDAYQLTQALGPKPSKGLQPRLHRFTVDDDTLLILGSDGLTDQGLLEAHWPTHLQPLLAATTDLETGVTELVQLANQHNGHDNITVVAVRILLQAKSS